MSLQGIGQWVSEPLSAIAIGMLALMTVSLGAITLVCRRRSIKAREAKSLLARAESMAVLGTMVASVTHDINTNLGVSITAITYLDDTIRDTQQKFREGSLKKSDLERHFGIETESMEILLLNIRKAAELVASFKRISVYQTTGTLETFNLKDYLRQVVISLTPKLRKTPYRVEIFCDEALSITGYPGAISQILTNLINNALTHAFEGRQAGTITLSAREDDDRVRIEVSDDGIGMTEQVLSKAFNPFFTTKNKDGGTGLGLSIVKTLVTDTLKGEITCESEVGKGTRFVISIPSRLSAACPENGEGLINGNRR